MKNRDNLITKEVLEKLYTEDHLTYQEIGNLFGKSRQRICQLMKKLNIDTSTGERFNIVCPSCGNSFSTTRGHFHHTALRYCSTTCYHAHRNSFSLYKPHKQGQRIARAVMEKHLGRSLAPLEVVHHIDGNNDNNSIDNLMVFVNNAEHIRFHHQLRIALGEKQAV